MDKRFITIFVVAVLGASLLTTYIYTFQKPQLEVKEFLLAKNTVVEIIYTGFIDKNGNNVLDENDEVFATNNASVINGTYKQFYLYECQYTHAKITIGIGDLFVLGSNLHCVSESLIGKLCNVKYVFSYAPEKAFGLWASENIKLYSIYENISRVEFVPKSIFTAQCLEPLEKGITFTHWLWNWNCTILDIDETTVIIEHLSDIETENLSTNFVINTTKYFWNTTIISVNSSLIILKHNVENNMIVNIGEKKGIVTITNGKISVDMNLLRGKNVYFEIEVVKIVQ